MINYIKIMSVNFPSEGVTGNPTDYSSLVFNGTQRTQVELDALWLPLYKEEKNREIDNRTQELIISNGFDFDTKNFSMSMEAQANWIGLKSMEALLTFPVEITTTSDEAYSLTQANLNAFCGTALGTKQAHLDSGRALKVQVNAATTEAEVDAVIDNR